MSEIIEWPACLSPASFTILPPSRTLSSAGSTSGQEQHMPSRRPPFGLSMKFNALFGDQVLAWRAMVAAMDGMAGRVRVPLFDCYAASDAALGLGSAAHSDGSPFADLSGYETSDIAGVTVTAAMGLRQISVDFGSYGQVLQAGQYFGVGEDPHIATSISWAGSIATIGFRASLRRNHVSAPLRLRPTMIARLASDDEGAIELEYGHYGAPQLNLVEAIDGPFS